MDSRQVECRECKGEVEVTYTKPPGIKSGSTKIVDNLMKAQLAAYGLTDYSNNVSTKHEPKQGPWGWQDLRSNKAVDLNKIGIDTKSRGTVEEHKIPNFGVKGGLPTPRIRYDGKVK